MLHITIHPPRPIALLARYSESLFRQRIKVSDLIHPYNDPHLRCKYIRLRTNRPIPLYRATYSLHRTSPFPPQSRSIYLRYRTHPPLLLPHSCKETTPHLPTLAQYTTHAPHHISPPLPDSSSTNDPTSTHLYLKPTHALLHRCASSPTNLRTHRPTSAHPRHCSCVHFPKLLWEIAPPQRTFTRQSTQKQPHAYALTTSLLRTNTSLSAHLHQATYVRSRSFLLRRGSCYTMRTERCSHTIKSLVPSCTSVCTEVLEKSL